MFARLKELIKQHHSFLYFCVAGVTNTAADFLVFAILTELGVKSAALCQAAGYTVGIIISFIINRHLTFKNRAELPVHELFVRYIAVNVISLSLSTIFIRSLVNDGVERYLSKVIVTAAVSVLNYFGYKFFVFRKKKKQAAEIKAKNRRAKK